MGFKVVIDLFIIVVVFVVIMLGINESFEDKFVIVFLVLLMCLEVSLILLDMLLIFNDVLVNLLLV